MSLLVTGAGGCIGAWVVKRLAERGEPFVALLRGDDLHRWRWIMDDAAVASVHRVPGDVTDAKSIERAVGDFGVRRIVHLAGLQTPQCRAEPALGARVNVEGTLNVLDVARRRNVERVVYASSAAVYGAGTVEHAMSEDDAPAPHSHYGVFKVANEVGARLFFAEHGLSSVGLRPFVVFGVGRDQGMTSGPTKAMLAAALRRPFTIPFTGPTDLQHAADVAGAFLAAARDDAKGARVFTLEGHCETMDALIARIRGAAGHDVDLRCEGSPLPIAPRMDGRRFAAAHPSWKRTDLDAAIRATIASFRELAREGRIDPAVAGLPI